MADYSGDHASAYADVAAAGVAVSFSRFATGEEQPDGTFADGVQTTIAGVAIAKKSDPVRFAQLGLILAQAVTLFFVPTAATLHANTSEFVLPGDTVVWNSTTLTVRDVGPVIAPNGLVIAGTIVAVQ
jgi:hypothetical protein